MYLAENRVLRIIVLCALYVAQGLPFGFVTVALAAYLSREGLDAEAIGYLLALVTLPWSFKWVWGPMIDRFTIRSMGKRRPWILLAQSLMAVTIGLMLAIPDLTGSVRLLGALIVVHNIFGSLQDVSVDALAVDLLTEAERGRANGLMYGSSYFGTFLGGAGLGWILANYGLAAALMTQVSLLLLIMLLPLLTLERKGDSIWPWTSRRESQESETSLPERAESASQPNQALPSILPSRPIDSVFWNLIRAFMVRSTLVAGILAISTRLGTGVLTAVGVDFYIKELNWTQQQYTSIQGGIGVFAGLTGSVLGGFLADKVGHKRLAAIASALIGCLWIGFALAESYWRNSFDVNVFSTQISIDPVSVMLVLQEFLTAVFSVALFAVFMTVSWPKVAATQFTAYMALMNLSTTIGSAAAGWMSNSLSVPYIFSVAGLIQFAMIAIIALVNPKQTREVLGEG